VGDWERPLSDAERDKIERASQLVFLRYEGKVTPHRSCGIAMAETFGLPTPAYQALRRGGITGCGECGVVLAGRLMLGEFFGDPDPGGAVTPALRAAMTEYEARWPSRIQRGAAPGSSIVCNVLTGQFDTFTGPERASFCTALARDVAGLVAEVLLRNGCDFEPVSIQPGSIVS
jgi:hypothetical protein